MSTHIFRNTDPSHADLAVEEQMPDPTTERFFDETKTDEGLGDIASLFKEIAQQAQADERLQSYLNPDDD